MADNVYKLHTMAAIDGGVIVWFGSRAFDLNDKHGEIQAWQRRTLKRMLEQHGLHAVAVVGIDFYPCSFCKTVYWSRKDQVISCLCGSMAKEFSTIEVVAGIQSQALDKISNGSKGLAIPVAKQTIKLCAML